MAKKYDNTNTGVAFKSKDRRNDKDPHLRGQINVGGTDYWLSVWTNKHDEHGTYLKLAVKLKEAEDDKKSKPAPKKAPPAKADFDDDLAF